MRTINPFATNTENTNLKIKIKTKLDRIDRSTVLSELNFSNHYRTFYFWLNVKNKYRLLSEKSMIFSIEFLTKYLLEKTSVTSIKT